MTEEPKIHFVATQQDGAEAVVETLARRYGAHELNDAEVIVALGGDGFMLRTLHRHLPSGLPVYGMKLGEVGFLMNRFREEELYERLNVANLVELNPLRMTAVTEGGGQSQALAINACLPLQRQHAHNAHLFKPRNHARHVPVRVNDGDDVELEQPRNEPVVIGSQELVVDFFRDHGAVVVGHVLGHGDDLGHADGAGQVQLRVAEHAAPQREAHLEQVELLQHQTLVSRRAALAKRRKVEVSVRIVDPAQGGGGLGILQPLLRVSVGSAAAAGQAGAAGRGDRVPLVGGRHPGQFLVVDHEVDERLEVGAGHPGPEVETPLPGGLEEGGGLDHPWDWPPEKAEGCSPG
mgnify:CR=1 FL=1